MSHPVRVFLIPVLHCMGLFVLCVHMAHAAAGAQTTEQSGTRASAPSGAPLYELFTSHGCSSCPPAEALLGKILQQDPSVVVLEWHVDYWNSLVHGGDGSWTDPFSSARWSQRQRQYNRRADLRGRAGVYTPQVIVNGQWAGIGSSERAVQNALASARQGAESGASLDVIGTDSGLQVSVDSTSASELWLVDFLIQATTDITAGENRHRQVTNHHMVKDAQRVGGVEAGKQHWHIERAAQAGVGCALLVQDPDTGTVQAAAYCPDNRPDNRPDNHPGNHVESGL